MILKILNNFDNNKIKIYLIFYIIFFTKYIILIIGLPQDLDPFLEKLFETPECESFISDSSFLAVATSECPPFHCNFPYQLCMRPSSQYQNEAENNCKELPEKCLIAANEGKPIEIKIINKLNNITITTIKPLNITTTNQQIITSLITKKPKIHSSIVEGEKIPPLPQPINSKHLTICDQLPAEGRFCGFRLKFAFNKETQTCDQFWFPGCRKEGNINSDNLFDTFEECIKAVQYCIKDLSIIQQKPIPTEERINPLSFENNGGGNSFIGQSSQPTPLIQNGNNLEKTPFGQAGQFIRLITNTIREVRERNNNNNEDNQKGGGLRFDSNQLTGLLQSFG